MNFGDALKALQEGMRVYRHGWNGRGMYLYLVPGSQFVVNRKPLVDILGSGAVVDYRPHIDMKTADDQHVPWTASQSDLLADDWEVLPK